MLQSSSSHKLKIFTQAIDECYSHSKDASIEYYSYEGLNFDIEKIIEKTRGEEFDEEIEDNSTNGFQSDEDVTKQLNVKAPNKLTKFLKEDWKSAIALAKQHAIKGVNFNMHKAITCNRKLTFDFQPALKFNI